MGISSLYLYRRSLISRQNAYVEVYQVIGGFRHDFRGLTQGVKLKLALSKKSYFETRLHSVAICCTECAFHQHGANTTDSYVGPCPLPFLSIW